MQPRLNFDRGNENSANKKKRAAYVNYRCIRDLAPELSEKFPTICELNSYFFELKLISKVSGRFFILKVNIYVSGEFEENRSRSHFCPIT